MDDLKVLKYVPIHKFFPIIKNKPVGVCLWGPPGSGKSSGLAHVKHILGDSKLFDFNTDAFVEFLLNTLFQKTYTNFIARKHEIFKRGNPSDKAKCLGEEESFYMEVRSCKFKDLYAKMEEYGESVKDMPESLNSLFNLCFVQKYATVIQKKQWDQFLVYLHSKYEINGDTATPTRIMSIFLPWWSRLNHHSFVVETTGRVWYSEYMLEVFSGIRNILYMPFIYNLEELQARVGRREEQFGNPTPDFVDNVFKSAYGTNLISVLDSFIFDQVIIQGNNVVNYVMMSLERIQATDSTYGYILVKEFANDIHEAEYIKLLLGCLFIPSHLHLERSILYDIRSKRWVRGH